MLTARPPKASPLALVSKGSTSTVYRTWRGVTQVANTMSKRTIKAIMALAESAEPDFSCCDVATAMQTQIDARAMLLNISSGRLPIRSTRNDPVVAISNCRKESPRLRLV